MLVLLVCLVGLLATSGFLAPGPRPDVLMGVTYSPRHARWLGLDPRSLYVEMLDGLGVGEVRLPLYWDEIEPAPDALDFSSVDFYLDQAATHGVSVVASIGYKQPRWPECYPPSWAAALSREELRARILRLVEAEVLHVRSWPAVVMWQVENEPFVPFGECHDSTVLTPEFVSQEIAQVRSLDGRPVLVTDSGENSSWLTALQLPADYFGMSLYRRVIVPGLGLWEYPLPAWSYALKDRLTRTILGRSGTTIVSEMQAEAWFEPDLTPDVPCDVQERTFPVGQVLVADVDYARRTQFQQVYLWGVEWWYWMRDQGHPEYVQEAQRVFASRVGATHAAPN